MYAELRRRVSAAFIIRLNRLTGFHVIVFASNVIAALVLGSNVLAIPPLHPFEMYSVTEIRGRGRRGTERGVKEGVERLIAASST
jgi:hypothetical protein